MNAETVRLKLLGTWRLVSFEWRNEAGDVRSELGNDPVGQLTYDASGTVSAQMMRRNQRHFGSDDLLRATIEEKAEAWSGYFGYFGTFSVGEGGDMVTHYVEGSSFPNLVDAEQVRSCSFAGSHLTLKAKSPWGHVSIVWDKVKAV